MLLQNFFEFVVTSDCFSIVSICDNPLESNTFCCAEDRLHRNGARLGTILAAELKKGGAV